jgi:hypothetical protein
MFIIMIYEIITSSMLNLELQMKKVGNRTRQIKKMNLILRIMMKMIVRF